MIVPAIEIATLKLTHQVLIDSIKTALGQGYQVVNAARLYRHKTKFGQPIAKRVVAQHEPFISPKHWLAQDTVEKLLARFNPSRHNRGAQAVIHRLLHWLTPAQAVDILKAIPNLLTAQQAGSTQHIGLSNLYLQQAIKRRALRQSSIHQIEPSPYLQRQKFATLFPSHHIELISYRTRTYGKLLQDPALLDIAHPHLPSNAHITLAWHSKRAMPVRHHPPQQSSCLPI